MRLTEEQILSDTYCYILGKEAYLSGKTLADNPFLMQSRDHFEWVSGYILEREETEDQIQGSN